MESEEIIDKGIEGENFVTKLAETSYLKYWCYPNPMDMGGDKKEICDLLILFFDTAIIISVKNYNVNGNYERFLKRVVEKSSKQLFGAQRKLFSSKEIVLQHILQGDRKFEPNDYKHIFKITVSVGEDFENYDFIDHDQVKGTVNIFNRQTFEAIIFEFDTIKDLTEYLIAREELLIANKGLCCNCNEKDLIAQYLMNAREFPEELLKDFENFTKSLQGKWQRYHANKDVILKKIEEENSYFIDRLVKTDVLPLENGELLAKEFMTMSRFERRIMANSLFELVNKYEGNQDVLARRYTVFNGIGFLFVYYPIERDEKEIDAILFSAQQLYSYFKKDNKIVMLAASRGMKQWKFGLFQATEMTDGAEKYLQALALQFGWFQNEKRVERNIKEYPNE
ncbi:hypothetical protein Q1W71_12015 [Flavobacterium pectinovorum]|uniref:hypothetical protein n=1 Tax=Flavobacterium pectinovorum TaxID=29533 RepID=UPI00265F3D2F|nr:hypothetical protein [Flavobacterium pectinovorum]WKL50470.1 hypothetical protein Q1W71_12015 [Flavobacterium pectinovorum]